MSVLNSETTSATMENIIYDTIDEWELSWKGAEQTVKEIMKKYIVIAKKDLPSVSVGTHLYAGSVEVSRSQTSEDLEKRALANLALAQHQRMAEEVDAREQETLARRRKNTFTKLFPNLVWSPKGSPDGSGAFNDPYKAVEAFIILEDKLTEATTSK